MFNRLVYAVLMVALLQSAPAAPRRVAITIDDAPVVGEMSNLEAFGRISAGWIGSLQQERVPERSGNSDDDDECLVRPGQARQFCGFFGAAGHLCPSN